MYMCAHIIIIVIMGLGESNLWRSLFKMRARLLISSLRTARSKKAKLSKCSREIPPGNRSQISCIT